MLAIVGLGNPGEKYKNNRHNVGQMFVDYLKGPAFAKASAGRQNLKIVKTDCFMNESGAFVKRFTSQFPNFLISNLVIAHDDLDIPLGKFKIQKGTGPELHNGIESIETQLKTKDFWRVRIGVDARAKNNRIDGETYLLQNFTDDELHTVQSLFPEIVKRLQTQSLIQ